MDRELMRARVALAGLLLSFVTFGVVSIAAPASASCINSTPALSAQKVLKGETCSVLYNRGGAPNLAIDVHCIGAGGAGSWVTVVAGTRSWCGRYFDAVSVRGGTQAWCHIVGTSQPDTLFWTAGYRPWNHWESVDCRIRWA